ncbi:MAG: HEAT repeat domain-containing protein [Merismopedia sp. SIO2A8]|nr:HEAT repeat domain-containing protein [Merismopedia sp. SIO2A8]
MSQQIELLTFDPADVTLLQQLVEGLSDPRSITQLKIIELFGEIGEEATPILVSALEQHPNPRVRHACAQALARLADPDSIPALIQALLEDPDPITRSSTSGALARMGGEAVPALLKVIASPLYPDTQKGQATWALSCLGAEAAGQLYQAFESDIADVRCAVVGAVATLAQNAPQSADGTSDIRSSSLPILLRAIADPESTVRIEAASGLGKLTYYNATPHLISLLVDSNPEVRKAVALAIGSLKDTSALEHLYPLINDPSPIVRPVAKWAIQQLNVTEHSPLQ